MTQIHLVMAEGGPLTAWLDLESAEQQVYKSNKEVVEVNNDLAEAGSSDRVSSVELLTLAIQDATILPYMAVCVKDGKIQSALPGVYLDRLVSEMHEMLSHNFDPSTDDARILDAQGKVVYSYDHRAVQEQLKKQGAKGG